MCSYFFTFSFYCIDSVLALEPHRSTQWSRSALQYLLRTEAAFLLALSTLPSEQRVAAWSGLLRLRDAHGASKATATPLLGTSRPQPSAVQPLGTRQRFWRGLYPLFFHLTPHWELKHWGILQHWFAVSPPRDAPGRERGTRCSMKHVLVSRGRVVNAPAGLTVFVAQELSRSGQDHNLAHVHMAGKPIWDQLRLPGF